MILFTGSPTSNLYPQVETSPIGPQAGAWLVSNGSFIHSPISWEAASMSVLSLLVCLNCAQAQVCTGLPVAKCSPPTKPDWDLGVKFEAAETFFVMKITNLDGETMPAACKIASALVLIRELK